MCTNDEGLFIPNRQLSAVIAGVLTLFFAFFMTGYFLGKRSGVEVLVDRVQRDMFADQVYNAALQTALDVPNADESSFIIADADKIESTMPEAMLAEEHNEEISSDQNTVRYYAKLIGFGTEAAAKKFVHKMATKGITLEVNKHTSKTAKGKVSHWYQVVTASYGHKEELIALVEKLTKEEMLKGVHISTC